MTRLLTFIKNPYYTGSFIKIDWSQLFLLLFAFYLLEVPFAFLMRLLIYLLRVEAQQIPLPYIKSVIAGIIIVPVYEELMMRLNLVFTRKNIIIF